MTHNNPYAAPLTQLGNNKNSSYNGRQLERIGNKRLFIPYGVPLPDRCIKCNEKIDVPKKDKKLIWHSPWLYLTLLLLPFIRIFALLIFVIIKFFVKKKETIAIGICSKHTNLNNIMSGAFFMSYAIGIIVLFMVIAMPDMITSKDSAMVWTIAAILIGIIGHMICRNYVYAAKIEDGDVTLAGCKKIFLESITDSQTG